MKKERINLTPGYCKDLNPHDKYYYIRDENCPGLWLRILPTGMKTWYYNYRPKNKSPIRIKLGRLEMLNPSQARKRVREIQGDITRGKDPIQRKKEWEEELTFSEALSSWLKSIRYAKSTVKAIKVTLNIWILRQTKDLDVRRVLNQTEDLRNKKLSSISRAHIKKLHELISKKSPYMANRVVDYLKMFFNYVFEEGQINPCTRQDKNKEYEYLDYLNETELEAVKNVLFKKDERSGRLLASHYKDKKLNPVSCCTIAFYLATSRRTRSEASNIQWGWLHMTGDKPRLVLPKTKTSKKQKDPKLSFGLGAFAVDIINTAQREKLFEDSAFYYPAGDVRNKYVFPSKDLNRRTGPNAKPGKTPYVVDVRQTWKRVLKMVGIERHLKVYATRHTVASAVLDETGNIKMVAETLGTSVKTASKYAKLKDEAVVETLDKIYESKGDKGIRRVK